MGSIRLITIICNNNLIYVHSKLPTLSTTAAIWDVSAIVRTQVCALKKNLGKDVESRPVHGHVLLPNGQLSESCKSPYLWQNV